MRASKRQKKVQRDEPVTDPPPVSTSPTAEDIKAWEDEKLSKIAHLDLNFFQQIKKSLKEYETKSTADIGKNLVAVLQLHM